MYVALHTADPTKAGLFTAEVSATGTAYARQALTLGALSTSGSYEQASNSVLNWAQATADWGTITHISLCDAATAGNQLYNGPLTVSKLVQNGDTFSIAAGQLVVQEG